MFSTIWYILVLYMGNIIQFNMLVICYKSNNWHSLCSVKIPTLYNIFSDREMWGNFQEIMKTMYVPQIRNIEGEHHLYLSQSGVHGLHYFSFFLSFRLYDTYFYPRRGCPKIMKFSIGSLRRQKNIWIPPKRIMNLLNICMQLFCNKK